MLKARRNDSEFIFPGTGKTGHLVETKRFTNKVVQLCEVYFTMHDVRRIFITVAESLDIPHYALKRLLNHRCTSDVTAGYFIYDVERLREPVERIAARLEELTDGEGKRTDK